MSPSVAMTPDLDLKGDLLRPRAFGADGAAELVVTHGAWVFLVGADVFKVKRPVNLGFLDYGTLARRKVACEAEVRLNRRLAPDVYFGVVPVVLGADGRARVPRRGEATLLADDQNVVDWAVHMKRMPEAHRADVLLRDGALDGPAIDRIAETLAAFHDALPPEGRAARYGSRATLEGNLEENFAQTRATIEAWLRPDEADELRRWQRAFLRGHGHLFEERVAKARVRDGHGDLRLEHVYLEGDRVTILDGIEFNERFRYGDVASDVAFLSMDLAKHRRVDLAERFLAAYARASNDFDLYAVVDFYESYRAYVRGKVASMIVDDPSVDEPTRRRASDDAREYFVLARAVGRRNLLAPSVVAVGGVIASGKSTVATFLGEALSAPVVDADRTRKFMIGVAPSKKLDEAAWSGAYDPGFTEHVYEEVLRRAEVVLASGRPVVIDASFRSATMRAAARDLAQKYGAPFRFVECRTPKSVCRERLRERELHRGVSDGRIAIFDDFCARFEVVDELVASEHLVLDTTLAMPANEAFLRSELDVWPAGLDA